MHKKSSMIKSISLLMLVTVISKVVGFGREMVVASLFGASIATDAWFIAQGLPMLLFAPLQTAITTVFIPVFDECIEKGQGKALIVRFGSLAILVTAFLLVLPTMLFARQLVQLMAPGFEPEVVEIAAGMVRVLILVILFRVLSAIVSAVLHVNRNFVIPGMEGIVFSVMVMGSAILLYRSLGIYSLVWGTLLAGLVQLLYKLPWLFKINIPGRLIEPVSDLSRNMLILLPPVLLSSMASQLKGVVDRMFASTLPEGSISYLNYSSLMNGLPVTLFIASVATVLYPSLVNFVNNKDMASYRSSLGRALNATQFLIMPIMVGFVVLSASIISFVYQRGAFDAIAVQGTSIALRYFALGLPAIVFHVLLTQSFYALKDTRTPLIATGIAFIVNAILNWVLIKPMAHGGLALANSIAVYCAAAYLLLRMKTKVGSFGGKALLRDFFASFAASVPMAALAWFLNSRAPVGAVNLVLIIAVSALTYFLFAWLFKVQGIRDAVSLIQERIK